MNLTLHPHLKKLIDDQVNSGRYATADDVIAAAVVNLAQQERLSAMTADELDAAFPGARQQIEQGLRQARDGNVSDGEAFFDELEREDENADRKTA